MLTGRWEKEIAQCHPIPNKINAHPQVLCCWWEEDLGQSDLALGLHFSSLVLCEAKYLGARCSCLPLRTPVSVFCPKRPGLFVSLDWKKGLSGFISFVLLLSCIPCMFWYLLFMRCMVCRRSLTLCLWSPYATDTGMPLYRTGIF